MAIFKENLGLKLLSLFLALVFWVLFSFSETKETIFPGEVPVTVKNLPSDMIAIYDTKTVKLKVRARKTSWQKLSKESFIAELDLAGLREGTYELPVKVATTLPEVSIRGVEPSKILLSIEPLVEEEVGVTFKLKGALESNYDLDSVKITPKTVKARGPKSEMASFTEATAVLELSGQEATDLIKKEVPLLALKPDGSKYENIVFNPDKVTIELPSFYSNSTKIVSIKPDLAENLAGNLYLKLIKITPDFVLVKGPKQTISDLQFIPTEKIIISSEGSFSKEVGLVLPKNVQLISSPFKVKVEIEVARLTLVKEVAITPEFVTAENLAVASYSPHLITVKMNLPAGSSSLPRLVIDIKGKEAGTHTITINEKMFLLPEGSTLISFNPKEISVQIQTK